MVVFPVARSPRMSSRCPRPIGNRASITFVPVRSGSVTGCRSATPGALAFDGPNASERSGPPPSSGLPSGSITRPSKPVPDRHARHPAGEPDLVARRNLVRRAQEQGADLVRAKVERQRGQPVAALQQFAVSHRRHPAEIRDPVADTDDVPDLPAADFPTDRLEPAAERVADLINQVCHPRPPAAAALAASSWAAIVASQTCPPTRTSAPPTRAGFTSNFTRTIVPEKVANRGVTGRLRIGSSSGVADSMTASPVPASRRTRSRSSPVTARMVSTRRRASCCIERGIARLSEKSFRKPDGHPADVPFEAGDRVLVGVARASSWACSSDGLRGGVGVGQSLRLLGLGLLGGLAEHVLAVPIDLGQLRGELLS